MSSKDRTAETAYPNWDMTKMWAGFKLPQIDADAMLSAQQKNIEALNQANKTAVEGWQAMAKKQAEFWLGTFEKTGTYVQEMAGTREPKEKLAKQAAFAKAAFEDGLSSVRETQALASTTTDNAISIVSQRWAEGLDEMVAYGNKAAAEGEAIIAKATSQ